MGGIVTLFLSVLRRSDGVALLGLILSCLRVLLGEAGIL